MKVIKIEIRCKKCNGKIEILESYKIELQWNYLLIEGTCTVCNSKVCESWSVEELFEEIKT